MLFIQQIYIVHITVLTTVVKVAKVPVIFLSKYLPLSLFFFFDGSEFIRKVCLTSFISKMSLFLNELFLKKRNTVVYKDEI